MTEDPFAPLARAVLQRGAIIRLDGVRIGGSMRGIYNHQVLWLGIYLPEDDMPYDLFAVASAYRHPDLDGDDDTLLLLVPYWQEFAQAISDPLIALTFLR